MVRRIKFSFRIDPFQLISACDESLSFLNSNDPKKKNFIAIGKKKELKLYESKGAFDQLSSFLKENKDHCVGYLSYDLKNDVEDLSSSNPNKLNFPLLHFYTPKYWIELLEDDTIVHLEEDEEYIQELIHASKESFNYQEKGMNGVEIKEMDEKEYAKHFDHFAQHIQRGDIYEANYCVEFSIEDRKIDPIQSYYSLNQKTDAPFSVYHQDEGRYLLCGSPERYIKKVGSHILTQPIKGTIKRGRTEEEDEKLKLQLKNDPKERGENVMIVDLVRNDISRIASKGSVKVDELFGVYTFKSVHQLISSISCELKAGYSGVDVLKATFPMGSMTGAPKIKAMEIIEKEESFQRGLYSGAFGYFTPNGDFDFNVVIRSILYNEENKYLSFPVGGALTSLAQSKSEFEECKLKADAMKRSIHFV